MEKEKSFTSKRLIDTTVLVYAYDTSEPKKHEIAKDLLKKMQDDGGGVLSVQNIVEFARALSEKAKPPVPYDRVRSYVLQLKSVFGVIGYDENTVAEALHIASNYDTHFFDALIVATMEENFVSDIITENEKDFQAIPTIKVLNPFK